MEKMSTFKQPPMKTPRLQGQVTRTESVPLEAVIKEVEKDHHTVTPQTSSTTSTIKIQSEMTTETERHPKGHKSRNLDEIWNIMDKQDYLRLTDTLTLNDVWVQPVSVEPQKGSYASVTFKEIVYGSHIKYRTSSHKMSVDDLLNMLYLCDCLHNDMRGFMRLEFGDWLNEKTANCIKNKGIDEGSNRAKLCNYIITEDREFSFYPTITHGSFGMFFRKTCCHTYPSKEENKLKNPAVIKCSSTKSSFEYLIEGRLLAIPDEWYTKANPLEFSMVDRGSMDETSNPPSTQPL